MKEIDVVVLRQRRVLDRHIRSLTCFLTGIFVGVVASQWTLFLSITAGGMHHLPEGSSRLPLHVNCSCACPTSSTRYVSNGPPGSQVSSFPPSMQGVVYSMGRISRDNFTNLFDLGYGLDPSGPNNEEVLILYSSPGSLPESVKLNAAHGSVPLLSVAEATENCNVLKIVMIDQSIDGKGNRVPKRHCLALLANGESAYHVHKYKREKGKRDPLLYSSSRLSKWQPIPKTEHVKTSNTALQTYLQHFDQSIEHLRPVADRVARGGVDGGGLGPVIVMVVNTGHMDLFYNFVCAARARNLDLSRVLLFATDEGSYREAQALNVTVYFDKAIFQAIPRDAARDYHDPNYGSIMMSKIYCVHMINALGYDLLFQDVDIVWYKDPLEYFAEKRDFDIYLQHDGDATDYRFAPLAGNTGFYFVRNNERTQHFLSVFSRRGDLVMATKSHQAAFTTLANEHMTLTGLRVKVLKDASHRFPTGYHYHQNAKVIRDMKGGIAAPDLFHANWLDGAMKKQALEYTLNWFVNEGCSAVDCCSKHAKRRRDESQSRYG